MQRITGVPEDLIHAKSSCSRVHSLLCGFAPGSGRHRLQLHPYRRYTFQFTAPNPPTVTDHPHNVDVFSSGSGTVNGTPGYNFYLDVRAINVSPGSFPNLVLTPGPLPSGLTPDPYFGDSFQLFAPKLTTLVSDVPNPYPECYSLGVCNDLLTFAFVPGEYSFFGFDPDHNQGTYTLDITAVSPTGATPEPPGLLLALTGMAGLALLLKGRSLSDSATL